MAVSHGVRVTVLLAVVLALALLCSIGALMTAREGERLMEAVVAKNVTSMIAAASLENALLEQRGLVSAFMLDGGRESWLEELDRRRPGVAHWLARARETAHTQEERTLLARLERIYAEYDGQREAAISLFRSGRAADARAKLLGPVRALAEQAHALCRELVSANQRYIDQTAREGQDRIERLTMSVTLGVLLTLAVCLTLLVLVLRKVLLPLRRLARDARALTADGSSPGPPSFANEMGELEFYSRALMSDVTEARRTLEEHRRRLLSAEKLAAVGKFAGFAAHELRNPLTAVRMWLFELTRSAADHPEIEKQCAVLTDEVSRLEDIATSFLEFSRPPDLRLGPQDVGAILDRTLELATHHFRRAGLRPVHEDGNSVPPVLGDPNQLRQVFLNLVINAAEAMESGGELRITEAVENGAGEHAEVVVRIQDQGPGVPEPVRPCLFEPFVTTKPHGTGLGLCIASRIVAQHGGSLVLESTSAQGSVFAVRLPAWKE